MAGAAPRRPPRAVEGGLPGHAGLALGPGPPPAPWAGPCWCPHPREAASLTVGSSPCLGGPHTCRVGRLSGHELQTAWAPWEPGPGGPQDGGARSLPIPPAPTHPPGQALGVEAHPALRPPAWMGSQRPRGTQETTLFRAPTAPCWYLPRFTDVRAWGLHSPCREWAWLRHHLPTPAQRGEAPARQGCPASRWVTVSRFLSPWEAP